jgi:glycerol-3-phosphate acyltransferase PlsX
VLDGFREEVVKSQRGKVGALMIRPAAHSLRRRLDPDTYGGAYLLGLKGLATIAHGNSARGAIRNAIQLSARGVGHDVIPRMAGELSTRVGAMRTSSPDVVASARAAGAQPTTSRRD